MRRRAAPPPCRRGSREAVPVAVAVAAVALEAIWVEAEAAEAIAAAAAMAAAMAAAKAEEAMAEEAMATAEEVKAKVEEATVVAKAEEAKAEARVGGMTVVATPAATPVATEAMVAERTGLVVEEGTVQATVQAMTVGTAAWLSSFFFKRACNSAKGTRAVVQHARPATKSRQNFATVSEFRRGMILELL